MAQRGPKKPSLQSALRMLTGEPFHEFWRGILTSAYADRYQFAEEELVIEVADEHNSFLVTGHADGYIEDYNCVVEVKSVADSTYQMVVGQGTPIAQHYEQANCYASAIGADWVLFIYHNRNSGEYTLMVAPQSEELFDATKKKWLLVARNRALGVLSPRPHADATASPCFYCDFKAECYEGFADQVKAFPGQTWTDSHIAAEITQFLQAKETRLKCEKIEEAIKSSIAKRMTDYETNLVSVPDMATISLKIGKNNNPLVTIKEVKGE